MLATFLRLYHLDADLPFDLCFSQAENTDWAWYLERPLAAAHGTAADDTLPTKYDRPWLDSYAGVFFKLFGTSQKVVSLLDFWPSLAVVLLLGVVVWQTGARRAALAAMLLAAVNFFLIVYSRAPMLYLWMAFSELVFIALWQFPVTNDSAKAVVKLLALAFMAVVVVYLKYVNLLLLPCLIIAAVCTRDWQDIKRSLKGEGRPWVLPLLGIVAAFFFAARFQLASQWNVMRVTLPAYLISTGSVESIFTQMVSYWRVVGTYVYTRMPLEYLLAYMACWGIVRMLLLRRTEVLLSDVYFAAIFLLGHLSLLLLDYRPVRFFLFLIPAAIYLTVRSGILVLPLFFDRRGEGGRFGRLWIWTAFWLLPLMHWGFLPLLVDPLSVPDAQKFWLWVVATVIMSVLFALMLEMSMSLISGPLKFKGRDIFAASAVVLLFIATLHAFWFWRWIGHPQYSLRESREDLRQILPHEARLGGPYAHLLTFGSDSKASYGARDAAYVALDARSWRSLRGSEEFRARSERWIFLEPLFVRGFEVLLFRIPEIPVASTSAFEKGIMAMRSKDSRQAADWWRRSQEAFPQAGAASRALLDERLFKSMTPGDREAAVQEALHRNPAHPVPWLWALKLADERDDVQAIVNNRARAVFYSQNSDFFRRNVLGAERD